METWQEWLEYYYQKYQYNFIVQKIDSFPHPWLHYKTPKYNKFISKEKYVSQREVFPDEVVFDIDMDKDLPKKEAVSNSIKIGKIICRRLKDLDFSHSFWYTGGSGCHIHVFFPELKEYDDKKASLMKTVILKEIGHGYVKKNHLKGRVQQQKLTTVQLEEAPHRKGGKKTLIVNYTCDTPNKIMLAYKRLFKSENKKNRLMRKSFSKKQDKEKPEAISFLESKEFEELNDGRDRALFILTAYYKQHFSGEELFTILDAWNKTIMKGYFSDRTIKAKIRSTRPGLNINYLTQLFDELGLDEKLIRG